MAATVLPIFDYMVPLSEEEGLKGFGVRRCICLRREDKPLPNLERLEEQVRLAKILETGYFPMYSNLVEMHRTISDFLH